MSYMVLARKWRPLQFDDLVGQEHIAQTLKNAITNEKISHGYLFTGTRGVGKTSAARILTKALNCAEGPTINPCGKCESCKGITQGSSMDVLEIDGASNRGVDDIRELREQVKYAPMQGKYKIYIIDEVHMLTKEAFNALLKTLEEPPPKVVFIFATTELRKVPQTILSRVQRFDFKRIPEIKIIQRLEEICKKEKIKCDAASLELIAEKADGSMRDSLSLFDQVLSFSGAAIKVESTVEVLGIPSTEIFHKLCDALIQKDVEQCFKIVEEFYNSGVEISEFLVSLGKYLRNLLFAKQPNISHQSLGISENQFNLFRQKGEPLSDGDIIRYGKIVSDLLFQIKSAANPRLTLEMGLAKMASLDRLVHISTLLKNLNSDTINVGAIEPEKKKSIETRTFAQPITEKKTAPEPIYEEEEPPPPSEAPQEIGENAQSEEKPSLTFEELKGNWENILNEWHQTLPILAGYFHGSKILTAPGNPIKLTIEFPKASGYQLAQSDKSTLKTVNQLIKKRVKQNFSLHFALKLEEENPKPEMNSPTTDKKVPNMDLEQLVEEEPIVGYLVDLFDGSMVE